GCAKMTSRIGGYIGGGNWKSANGTAHYGRNFSLQWLKLCELSFQKTHHLRNPYNDNLPVKVLFQSITLSQMCVCLGCLISPTFLTS
uniref:YTH domain-containing family protein n=1 Tax=Aegilops tauschii subsp. strangulata TaxID=200361 RepID=A0A453SX18_AEGTS